MEADGGSTNVTVKELSFDGNRYDVNASLNCLPGNSYYYDLALAGGGTFLVEWVNFINAPGDALNLGGNGSTVRFSNFGNGGFGIGPGSPFERSLSPEETATHSTAIRTVGTNTGAWANFIAHAGTAAINLGGTAAYAYGNHLYRNRYEVSDGITGGQLYLEPGSTNGWVAGNVIDGTFWVAGPTTTGCPALATGLITGVEAYGFGHRFYNNEITQHSGSAMQFAGSNPTGQITISSAMPFDPGDTPRYIEGNANGGIVFLGDTFCAALGYCQRVDGVTMDDILLRNNAIGSIAFDGALNNTATNISVPVDGTSTYATYTGFFNGSCMSGNTDRNGQPANPPTGGQNLGNPFPGNYASYRGNACPVVPWTPPNVPPAASHQPGWPW